MQGHKEQPYLSMLLLSRLSKIPENKKTQDLMMKNFNFSYFGHFDKSA